MTTAAKLYASIPANTDASFIANVILNGCGKPVTRLRCLVDRLSRGDEFRCLSFRMPYEGFFLNGQAVKFDILLASPTANPKDFRLLG